MEVGELAKPELIRKNSVMVVWHEWEDQKDGKTRLKLKIGDVRSQKRKTSIRMLEIIVMWVRMNGKMTENNLCCKIGMERKESFRQGKGEKSR